jgi:integrase
MALRIAAVTGMRRGEVLGLRWSDIDFVRGSLSVNRAVSCTGYEIHINRPKTSNSRRSIDLDSATIARLRSWQVECSTIPARVGGDAPVFARGNGEVFHPHLLSQAFDRLQTRAALPRVRLHDLCHTHATLMLKHGVPLKVVSERLGHSSPAFTMAVYQRVLPGMQRDAADRFSQLITPRTDTNGTADASRPR